MTHLKAENIAFRAKPCPFCGEQLVTKDDHHGSWVAHKDEPGACFDSTIQLMDETDLKRWNVRA